MHVRYYDITKRHQHLYQHFYIRIQIQYSVFTVTILKINIFSLIIKKQLYPRLLYSHQIYKKTCISLIKGYNCILLKSSAIVKFKIITPTIFAQILMVKGLLKVILFLVITVEVVERRWRLLLSKCRLVGSRFV